MPFTSEGIGRVRVCPLALDVVGGTADGPPGGIEVTWDSSHTDRWHQVYVNGRLCGVTAQREDRQLVVSAPAGQGGPATMLLVEVVAVDAASRWRDFSQELAGFDTGGEVRLSWQAGLYLDPNLEAFEVFTDARTGIVDYLAPVNDAPLAARPGGQLPWGYGTGGYGVGGYGVSAARYEWTTDVLEPGTWRFAVLAVDAAGNRLATAAEIELPVTPVARPAENLRPAGYDPQQHVATLAWEPSPDV